MSEAINSPTTGTRDLANAKLLTGPLRFDAPYPELSRKLRMGIVGGGRIAKVHRWAAALSERWVVSASTAREYTQTDNDPVALARAGIRINEGERLYASFTDLAREEEQRADGVDAVAICLPNHLHFEAAKCFLEHGIAVLCEKPLVTTPGDGAELLRIAGENGCVTATSYPYAAYPMIRQARHLIASGLIGKVQHVYVEFTQDFLMASSMSSKKDWRLDPSTSGMAGSTADIGTHALHLLEFVSGVRVEAVAANLTSCGPSKALDDTFHILLRCANGVPGVLVGSQAAAGITTGPQLRVHGEKGTISWTNGTPQDLTCQLIDQPTMVYTRGMGRGICADAERFSRRGRGNTEGWVEAFANMYLELAMCVGAHKDKVSVPAGLFGLSDFETGLRGVQFVQAAVESAKSDSRWTRL
jgi:predicted dehydrogenase